MLSLMKQRYAFLSSTCLLFASICAQEVQWLRSASVGWDMNYQMPGHLIEASRNGHVAVARQFGDGMSYGQDVFNSVMIERIDPATGLAIGACPMGDSVLVECMAVDDAGTIYVGGRFIGGIQFCDGNALGAGIGFLTADVFIAAFSADDLHVLWARNLTSTYPDAQRLPAMEMDAEGNLWYGIEEFENIRLIKVDAQGNDVDQLTINGTRVLGGFSFDPSNNVFVSGSTGDIEGPLVFGGQSVPVPEPYMMFVLHFNANGGGDWAQLAHDITFSAPDVVAGVYGEAFVSGVVHDSLSWGDVHLHGPNWGTDVFLVRVNAAGQFDWGLESDPGNGSIIGDMMLSKGPSIACDANGKVYLTGTIRGSVDWGSGIVSAMGSLQERGQTVVCFTNNGTPLWQKTSTAGALNAQNVTCDDVGTAFFTAHTMGSYTMPPSTVNEGGAQAFADGRIDLSTSVTEHLAHAAPRTWPNPAQDEMFINLTAPATYCRVVSPTGAVLQRQRLVSGINRIDVSRLAAGAYTLLLDDGTTALVLKD